MFEYDLCTAIDAYDLRIDTSDGTLGIDASVAVCFVASSDEDTVPLAVLTPTVDLRR